MRLLCCKLLGVFLTCVAHAGIEISNVNARQIEGTRRIEISFGVNCQETNQVTTWLSVSNGNTAVVANNVTGDVGEGISTGPNKLIIWNMEEDWSKSDGSLEFSIGIDDRIREQVIPSGGDPKAVTWEVINDRWIKNIYPNGHITYTDRIENIMWPDPASFRIRDGRYQAQSFCENVEYAWYSDWILPNQGTLMKLHENRFYSMGIQDYSRYWSSSLASGSGGAVKYVAVYSYYYGYMGTYRVSTEQNSSEHYVLYVLPSRSVK